MTNVLKVTSPLNNSLNGTDFSSEADIRSDSQKFITAFMKPATESILSHIQRTMSHAVSIRHPVSIRTYPFSVAEVDQRKFRENPRTCGICYSFFYFNGKMEDYALETVRECLYRVFSAQADWTFILQSELPEKELRHLPREMTPHGTTY
jgi:hypothetical protein